MDDNIQVPILRNDGETLQDRMSENGYQNVLPARYMQKDSDGNVIEEQEDVFERVAKNIAVAESIVDESTGEIALTEFESPSDVSYEDVEGHEKVEEWADKFQHHMEHLKFMPNTPTLINAGTDIQQLSACFVDSPEDDMKDIGDTETEASLIFQSGGGVGYDFGNLRPYGDVVASTGGIASGPITFMQRYDQNCETVAQGGVRRGAQMGTMPVTHPDIIHFIHAKNKDVSLAHTLRLNDPDDHKYNSFGKAIEEAQELIDDEGRVPEHLRNAVEGHLSNFNISVTIPDEFMEAVQNGGDYELINPRTGDVHIATEETKDMYSWFGLGEEVEVGEELTLPAEEIWTRIVEGAYENGEPGVIYLDSVNDEHSYDIDEHPQYKQTTTNPCVAEGTLVNTPHGYRPVENINVGDEINTVYGSETVDEVLKFDDRQVYEVTFSDGGKQVVTEDHRYHALEQESSYTKRVDDVPLRELSEGDSVRILPDMTSFEEGGNYERGLKRGILIGDGCYTEDTIDIQDNLHISSNIDDEEYNENLKNLFETNRELDDSGRNKTVKVWVNDATKVINELDLDPSKSHNKNFDIESVTEIQEAVGILDGLMASDGNINLASNHPQARWFTSSEELAQNIRRLMIGLGMNGRISVEEAYQKSNGSIDGRDIERNHDLYTVHISGESLRKYINITNIGDVHPSKGKLADEIQREFMCTGNTWKAKIESIEYAGTSDVYDLYCEESDTWVTDGYVQRGCAEQPLMEYEACLYGDETILTDDGVRKIEDFETDKVASHSDISEISTVGKIIPQGEKETITVKLDGEIPIRCTPDHEFKTDKGWVEAQDLIEEDASVKWMENNPLSTPVDMESESAWRAFSIGWMHGDGWLTENSIGISFNEEDGDFELKDRVLEHYHDMFGERKPLKDDPVSYQEQTDALYAFEKADELGFNYSRATKRSFPEWFYDASENEQLAFLRGLFTADAGIGGKNDSQIQYATSSYQLADEIQKVLGSFGIQTRRYVTEFDDREDQIRISITKESAVEFMQYIGIETARKREEFNFDAENYTDEEYLQVVSIEENKPAIVYDLNVPETNQFFTNGALVHNCNLGHINLSTIVDEDVEPWSEYENNSEKDLVYDKEISDFLDQAIDWNEFNERIEVGTRFLDNVVTMSDFPIDEISETVRKNRKIGLGIMGLAQLYIQLGIEYGSEVGNEIARQLMQHINHKSKGCSSYLAGERDSFENWEDSKYADVEEYHDWIEKHVGEWATDFDQLPMRNHNTTTIAPTGTTSMLADTTGGCEPIYNVAFYKNVTEDVQGDEMLVEFDSLFLQTLRENDIDVEEVKEEAQEMMEANEFDGVEDLSTVPDEIGSLFVTTGDLDSKEHASVMCALQEGVDSSISKCVSKGTMIQTDQGVFRVEEMGDADEKGEDSFGKAASNYTCSSEKVVEHYYGGEREVTEVRLDNGATIEGATNTHKVMTSDGWKVLGEIEEGDVVFRDFKESHGRGGASLEGEFEPTPWSNEVEVPSEMSKEYAEILGMLAADGCAVESNGTIHLTAEKEVVSDRFRDLCRYVFDVDPYHDKNSERTDDFWFTSKDICKQIINLIGTGSYNKKVPDEILSGSAEEKLSFLKGVTLDGYDDNLGFTVYEGMSEGLADGIEVLCRSFGLPNVYRGRKYVRESDAYAHGITVSNEMQEIIETVDPEKNNDIHYKPYKVYFDRNSHELSEWASNHEKYSAIRSIFQREKDHMYNETAEALNLSTDQPVSIVTDVSSEGTEEVYDIEVENSHQYVTNGIISHNTLNAPNDATVEDAKETFEYVYENDGKSVTFYRDGSRTKQVKTTRKDNQETADEADDVDETPRVEPRERPKTVTGQTEKVDTGYGTLYVTINEDEIGPVEVFATVGKSGGTMESLTESLARVISLGLRSGVPMSEVIDQIEGIRSPNLGWDEGEDIKSIPDGIAIALERYQEREENMGMNHTTVIPENYEPDNSEPNRQGEPCPECGEIMQMQEGCAKCDNCGYSAC